MSKYEYDISKYPSQTNFEFHNVFLPVAKKNIIPIGLDVGYSSTKVYSLFGRHTFPSLPVRVFNKNKDDRLMKKDNDIVYWDEKGNMWYVGELARNELENGRIAAQTETLYGWKRIHSEEYIILLRIGILLGMIQGTEATYEKDLPIESFVIDKNLNPIICTGLPAQYLNRDRPSLVKCFTGNHNFKVQIGKKEPVNVQFTLTEDDIYILSQPYGTLWALSSNNQGFTPDRNFMFKQFLIFDGGYHTADTFNNKGRLQGEHTTWENISMHRIMELTRKAISEQTNGQADYPLYMTEKYLTSESNPGVIMYGLRQRISLHGALIAATNQVAEEALREINTVYNNLNSIDALICTGGVGCLLYEYFRNFYETTESKEINDNQSIKTSKLEVLIAERTDADNPTDNFDTVMANAYGFYCYLICRLKIKFGEVKKQMPSKAERAHSPKQAKELLETIGDGTSETSKE